MRVAVVGCGVIAPTHVRALRALAPDLEVVACADVLPDRAAAMAAEFGLRATDLGTLLADPEIDAVSVCTPSGTHAEVAIAALRAGKHVVVEKPMDVSVAACDAMLAAQRESGTRLAVISQHRFDPASREVHRAVTAGELGRLVLVDVRVPWYRDEAYYASAGWRGTWALDGGGAVMNQGVHTLDLMLWIAGPVVSVTARAGALTHPGLEVEDTLVGTLEFASGALGSVAISTAAYPGLPARLAVHGTHGAAVVEGDRLALLAVAGRPSRGAEPAHAHARQVATGGTKAATAALDPSAADEHPWGEAHRRQLADFAAAVRHDREPLVDGHQGRAAVVLVTALYESARTGHAVTVPPA